MPELFPKTQARKQTPPAPSRPLRRYIAEMGPGERVEGVFSITNTQLGRTRQDKPYLRCLIGDKTAIMPGRVWTIDEATYASLPADGFVFVTGETQAYQGDLQLIIQGIGPAEVTDELIRELLPSSSRDPAEMFDELAAQLGTLKHPAMLALARTYLDDDFLMSQLRQCPAAKTMHHAYLGGLLEHTLQLLNLAAVICPLYPRTNRDLVMVGLFLHDLGKTRELCFDRAFAYTDHGELIGHIVEGAVMLRDKIAQMMRATGLRLPAGAAMVLEHIILSHHALPEFGAAKIPATPEAILVAAIDNMDAKTAMALAAARPEREREFDLRGNFTEKHWGLGTKIYRPDPLEE